MYITLNLQNQREAPCRVFIFFVQLHIANDNPTLYNNTLLHIHNSNQVDLYSNTCNSMNTRQKKPKMSPQVSSPPPIAEHCRRCVALTKVETRKPKNDKKRGNITSLLTLCWGVIASIRPMNTRWETSSNHAYAKPGALAGRKICKVLLKVKEHHYLHFFPIFIYFRKWHLFTYIF